MKRIVLATDFSPAATEAAHFAYQLALGQHAELLLLHAYQLWPDNAAKTGNFPLSAESTRETSEKALQQLSDRLAKKFGADLPIRCLAQEGHAPDVIRQVTRTETASLLIMSTVGTAPQGARLMGSLATEMIARTEVPLLLIPPGPGGNYAGIKNSLLAIDLTTPPDLLVFETALDFARSFGSTIDVLCVSHRPDSTETNERAIQIRHLLTAIPHTLTILAGSDVYETLLTFAHTGKADLIMMLPQMRNWLQRLFVEGETQRMARLTDIPLLAVV